ncbi:hypothetical protein B0H17DRAFT_1138496 [Mycena rosella]|uniref:Carboxylic ester hydrolase n=1 Tax=Mycena rosella TaxID=1033263 RepID=A0AAD7D654_MYCRO|nr:hypothetical protein B0H17DRAFT_1138496 [Mycena rosella]
MNMNVTAFFGTCLVVPVVDGEFITQCPTLALAQGKVNGKALRAVTNTFEGTQFVNQSTGPTANATQYTLDLFPDFGLHRPIGWGEFAVLPATHGMDSLYYFPSLVPMFDIPVLNNTAFTNAFAGTKGTRRWFNKTETDLPLVAPIRTSDALLERCRFWDSVGDLTGQ